MSKKDVAYVDKDGNEYTISRSTEEYMKEDVGDVIMTLCQRMVEDGVKSTEDVERLCSLAGAWHTMFEQSPCTDYDYITKSPKDDSPMATILTITVSILASTLTTLVFRLVLKLLGC